jgi:hypothetical protein
MDEAGAAMAWKAKQLIRTQFHLPSTSKLARELHCNADYLGRVFRRLSFNPDGGDTSPARQGGEKAVTGWLCIAHRSGNPLRV